MLLLGWSNYAVKKFPKKVFPVDNLKFPMEVIVNIHKSTPGNIIVDIDDYTASLIWFEWLDAPIEEITKWK